MGYYYLSMEKRNERDFPSYKKYLCISKPNKPSPKDGKKRLTQEQTKEYEDTMNKYNQTIAALEFGHVIMNNNKVETDNIKSFGADILFRGMRDNQRIFHIQPLQSEKEWQGDRYYVSEFTVDKEITTPKELLDQAINDYDYFDIEGEIFDNGLLANEGYKDRCLEWFKYLTEQTGEKFLDDMIRLPKNQFRYSYEPCIPKSFYDNKKAHDFVQELFDKGYLSLSTKSSYQYTLLERLLRLRWTDFALDMFKQGFMDEANIQDCKSRKNLTNVLSMLTDDANAREIIKLLGIKANVLTLVVKEDIDDGYDEREVERKEFTNMGELRAYLITQYHVPFEFASGSLEDLTHDDYSFQVVQEENI